MAKRRATRTHRKHVETELASLERQLMQALQERLDKARSASAHGAVEFMDMVADSEIDDLAARIVDSDSAKIVEIEDALTMLREGRYGICQDCGRRIAKRRLEAKPFATRCIQCKMRQERQARPRGLFVPHEAEVDIDLGGRETEEETVAFDELFRDVNSSELF